MIEKKGFVNPINQKSVNRLGGGPLKCWWKWQNDSDDTKFYGVNEWFLQKINF